MRRLTESFFKSRKKQRRKASTQLVARQRRLLTRNLVPERLEARQLLAGDVWINEFHYDNIGTDTNEFVEIAGPAGTDLSGHQIVLYNGANGTVYNTLNLSGSIPDEGAGFGAIAFNYPSNGIQNGSPDGIALVANSTLVEFISYEGTFTGSGGPADGVLSVDVGVAESNSTTATDESLQRDNSDLANPGIWGGPALASPGLLNTAVGTLSISATVASINEGSSGATDVTFLVNRLGFAANAASVEWTVSGPVDAGDFGGVMPGGTVNFAAGETTQTITVSVSGDTDIEDDETFTVTIANPVGATVDVASAGTTILNDDPSFSLQILHASDLEGGVDAVNRAANFAAIVDQLETDAANAGIGSILLSAGDNYIGGPFFSASGDFSVRDELRAAYQTLFSEPGLTDIRESNGRVDISIMNILGFDASAIGNHEFDFGSDTLAGLINSDIRGSSVSSVRWLGAQFPYLSANLDFSGDSFLSSLFTGDILDSTEFQSDLSNLAATAALKKIAPATKIMVNGEWVGVVGATTQLLQQISSPSGTTVLGPQANDMSALAGILQPVIDDLTNGDDNVAGNEDDVNKVVLVSHLQQIALESELAALLSGVDVIVAGGSDTLLADADDILRPGDTAAGDYPLLLTSAAGEPVAVVSTDGEYSYVGRLTLDFDVNGIVIPESIVDATSGAYATDDAGVLRVTGAADVPAAIAASTKATEVKKLTDAVQSLVTAKDSNILGRTGVFMEGRRSAVRTEETNLGNLTADANLAAAKTIDLSTVISIKNGGGIRAEIGTIRPDGTVGPTSANAISGKQAGEVSQLDIENTLRFNNQLSLVTLTAAGLKEIIEHGVADSGPGRTPGRFPQVSGISFSYDTSLAVGSRVVSLAVTDQHGNVIDEVVRGGVVQGDATRSFRVVTLNFLASGGDGYPFPALGTERVDIASIPLPAGLSNFSAPGTEQDALAEFLIRNNDKVPYYTSAPPASQDRRIQDLSQRPDSVFSDVATEALPSHHLSTLTLGAAEISAFDPVSDRLYVTHAIAGLQVVDFSDPLNPTFLTLLDPAVDGAAGSGVTSVAVGKGPTAGIVAIAVPSSTITDDGNVLFYDTNTNAFLGMVTVGPLPDMLTFSPDGATLLVANEGQSAGADNEPDIGPNPPGSISVITVDAADPGNSVVQRAGFEAFDADEAALRAAGVRIFPGIAPSVDFEPEFITVSADGTTAYAALQENNAIAVIDIASATVTEILPLGLKDHTLPANALDPSNTDGVAGFFRNFPLKGMYMPDAVAAYESAGATYLITANEGDSRGDADEERADPDLPLDPTVFPFAADLQVNSVLGRINASKVNGDIDDDGDFDEIHVFGGRSFSIWDTAGNQVFDSGNFLERFTLASGSFVDSRSDDKGPEPEGVTIATIGSSTYAFVGLERTNDVVVFDVTNPENSHFVTNIRMPGDVSPEGLTIISAADSPLGYDMIVVTNEVSQTVSTFALAPALSLEVTQSSIEEGQTATIGRITRQGDTSADLIVTLNSSDSGELTVPATVTIPAGASFVDFDVTGVDDGAVDGDQLAAIQASAAGLVGTSVEINVIDTNGGGYAPTVTAVQVNDGGASRSLVTSLQIDFDVAVNVGSDAFLLQNRETGEFVSPTVQTIDANSVLLTFDGGPSVIGRAGDDSLADGNYILTIVSSQITSVSSGTAMATDYLFGDDFSDDFYRLFGDGDHDGDVDVLDFLSFRRSFRSFRPEFDSDGNGIVDKTDFLNEFLQNFRTSRPSF